MRHSVDTRINHSPYYGKAYNQDPSTHTALTIYTILSCPVFLLFSSCASDHCLLTSREWVTERPFKNFRYSIYTRTSRTIFEPIQPNHLQPQFERIRISSEINGFFFQTVAGSHQRNNCFPLPVLSIFYVGNKYIRTDFFFFEAKIQYVAVTYYQWSKYLLNININSVKFELITLNYASIFEWSFDYATFI